MQSKLVLLLVSLPVLISGDDKINTNCSVGPHGCPDEDAKVRHSFQTTKRLQERSQSFLSNSIEKHSNALPHVLQNRKLLIMG